MKNLTKADILTIAIKQIETVGETTTLAIKNEFWRSSPPLSKVVYYDKINVINNALGLHSYISRVQGHKLKAKNEI